MNAACRCATCGRIVRHTEHASYAPDNCPTRTMCSTFEVVAEEYRKPDVAEFADPMPAVGSGARLCVQRAAFACDALSRRRFVAVPCRQRGFRCR